MSSEKEVIIADFVVESREHLADVENQLLAIEAAKADVDVELVNEVFHAVHSIKGAAGSLGFLTLGDLAHHLENVLNRIRNRELTPNSATTATMLRATDTLRHMVDDIQNSADVDISQHLLELREAIIQTRIQVSAPRSTNSPELSAV